MRDNPIAVYILSRALGKIRGAALGSKIMKMPSTVTKYLGLTLLPHSGVSLVFTESLSSPYLRGPFFRDADPRDDHGRAPSSKRSSR